MNFSDRLKQLRAAGGLTVREVANVLDVAPSTISNYEQDYRRPDFETLGKLADYFDVSLDYLLARTKDPHGTDTQNTRLGRIPMELSKISRYLPRG